MKVSSRDKAQAGICGHYTARGREGTSEPCSVVLPVAEEEEGRNAIPRGYLEKRTSGVLALCGKGYTWFHGRKTNIPLILVKYVILHIDSMTTHTVLMYH